MCMRLFFQVHWTHSWIFDRVRSLPFSGRTERVIFALLVVWSMGGDVSLLGGWSVCPFIQHFHPGQDILISVEQTVLNFCMDINGHHWLHGWWGNLVYKCTGYPSEDDKIFGFTFHLAPSSAQTFSFYSSLVYSKIKQIANVSMLTHLIWWTW